MPLRKLHAPYIPLYTLPLRLPRGHEEPYVRLWHGVNESRPGLDGQGGGTTDEVLYVSMALKLVAGELARLGPCGRVGDAAGGAEDGAVKGDDLGAL